MLEHQGSGYVIVNTAACLRSLGHSVDVIPPENFEVLKRWTRHGFTYRMAIGMAKWVYAHKKKVAGYDMVFLYGAEAALALSVIKKVLRLKVPVVLHSNGLEVHVDYQMKKMKAQHTIKRWYHFDKSWIYTYSYKNVDAIINVSAFEHDFAVDQLKIDGNKVYYLEPCLPDAFFANDTLAQTAKKPIIAYCGTWITRKGVDIIKEVIPAILQKFPGYGFRIIGTGNTLNVTDHFSADILSRIDVHPFVKSKEQMIKLYSEASIFIFPSLYESFGLVVPEAMFCGCATICTRTGFAATVKNNEEALILDEPDAPQLYAMIERLIMDNNLRQKLAHNGQIRTRLLRWSNYREQLDIIIGKVVSNHRLPSEKVA